MHQVVGIHLRPSRQRAAPHTTQNDVGMQGLRAYGVCQVHGSAQMVAPFGLRVRDVSKQVAFGDPAIHKLAKAQQPTPAS